MITEYVEGASTSDLSEEDKAVVWEELQSQVAKLKALKSCHLGGPSGIVVLPYRVLRRTEVDDWHLRPSSHEEYVILPQRLVTAECHCRSRYTDNTGQSSVGSALASSLLASSFPIYNGLGPSVAIDGESDDSLDFSFSVPKQVALGQRKS